MSSDSAETNTTADWTVREGMAVFSTDGEKLGEVENATGNYVLVKKGFLFSKEFYIPAAAIANVSPDAVYLEVTKEIALQQGWNHPPTAEMDGKPVPHVVTGEPDVTMPAIGVFNDEQSGTYVDEHAGTQVVEIPDAVTSVDQTPETIREDTKVSDATSEAQAAEADHDSEIDEGTDTPHLIRTADPLPIGEPDSADEPAPGDGDIDEVPDGELDPLVSEDAEEDPKAKQRDS